MDGVGKGQLTTEEFPFDLDTTSLGLTVLRRDKELASSVMDEMLDYVDTDGIIQVLASQMLSIKIDRFFSRPILITDDLALIPSSVSTL